MHIIIYIHFCLQYIIDSIINIKLSTVHEWKLLGTQTTHYIK